MNTMTSVASRIEILQTDHIDPIKDTPVSYPPIIRLIQLGFQVLGPLFPKYAGKVAFNFFSTPRIRARHKVSDEILESAKIFEFLYGKLLLKGYEWGSGDQTILLVHGWESRGTALRTFVPELVSQGYRVLAFDGPAHGDSGGNRTNIVDFAGAVRAAIRQTGNLHGIITHSFGGASTVYALANAPEPIEVEKMVFIAVPNSMERVLQETIQTLKLPKSVANEFFRLVEARLQTPVAAANVDQAYTKIQIGETLIVHDRYDPVVKFTSAQEIHNHWNDVTLLVSEGLGHYRLMKNPDVIQYIGNFLNK